MSYFTDRFGDTYKVIRNYISSEEANTLGENYKEFVSTDGVPTEATMITSNAYDFYNRPEQVALLSEKVSHINELLGKKVLPAYSFVRQYGVGSFLGKHTDRKSCEVSLSIHLCGDKEWPFCIEDKEGNPVELILHPGDAVLYDAPNATHWREEYDGEFYIQTFHHYVTLGGEYENLFFDNNDKDFSLTNYIKQYKESVPPDICDMIVKYAEQFPNRWENATTIQSIKDNTIDTRICESWNVLPTDSIDDVVYKYITEASSKFCNTFPHFNLTQDTGYQILRYKPGGKYDYHTDQHATYNREVTIILNLNDDYEGGNLCHIKDNHMIKMGKGDIIIFPANFMYPHRITPITSGVRYSIVTWAV
ncbi:ferrochelatase [Synechococcus phage ACG-2014f]|uniref:Ferrochelatase n=1 Tax=Synechococcus phage ACG-2014f TaxID=1493511 RepID=A0A0E3HKU1_9CAUD|nr:ferrochelatase [Synechococcus phage ACG-2014f]AIX32903.1 ferrochelatase [Synechococcus phage ACG-2014f]